MPRLIHCLSLDTVGGVESVFADYLQNAKSKSHEHHLMILNEKCNALFASAVLENIKTQTQAKYLGSLKLPRFLRPFVARRQLNRVQPEVRIIYNSLDNPSAWVKGSYASKIVYYERGGAWWNLKDSTIIKENIRRTDRFFCNSNASKRILEIRYSVEPGLCDVIYNPSRLTQPLPSQPREPDRRGEFVIGMAGRLIPAKGMVIGLHALANLLKRSPNFRLLIAGDGPELATLRETSRLLGVERSVSFLGIVRDMSAFYRSLDLFLCPSLREPFGNVVVEANACGCPVLCTDIDGLPEAIVPGETGLCLTPTLSIADYLSLGVHKPSLPEIVYHPNTDDLRPPLALDPESVSDALWDLAQSPELVDSMSRAGIARVRNTFHIDCYVERFHSLIQQCLNN
jgi:glycosyltransferase involved in cell wall biosynthesis